MSDADQTSSESRRRGRWAVRIFATLIVVALIWTWGFYNAQRQDKWIRTAIIGLVA